MMEKQINNLEEELKNTKQRLNEAETEKNQAVAELREAKELANAGLSAKKAEQLFSELKSVKDSLLNSKKEIESRDKELTLLNKRVESAKVFEVKLAERDASLEKLNKKIRELENEVEKTKQSESNMLESLMIQTQQITQTKMDLEESKQEVITLHEQLENLQRGSRNGPSPYQSNIPQRGDFATARETQALKDEITNLKNEIKFATEAEEKSKKAMDDLASALREVATESSTATENLRLSEQQVTKLKSESEKLKSEIENLKEELESQTDESERLRVEYDEALLTWTAKEHGFIGCIKKTDEENASLKHENQKLREALVIAESNSRFSKDESSKLRDILKQALNESNVAKEASNIARAENSDLKDLLAEKEESLHFLTKENERLRINEVAARENVKEFKRLLAAKAEANKHYDDNNNKDDVFNSPLSSLYEDHLDGRMTPQRTFSFDFDFDDITRFSKKEEDKLFDTEEEYHMAEIDVNEDPEKAEALKGSIFDTTASPKSEPQTPKSKSHHLRVASGGSGQNEDGENILHSNSGNHHHHHHHHHHHTDDDDKGYIYNIYNKRKLIKKFGELIIGKTYGGKKEGSPEQVKEQGKEQGKDQGKEQGKDQGKEQGKDQGKEPGKDQGKEQGQAD